MLAEFKQKLHDKKKKPRLLWMLGIFIITKIAALVHLFAIQQELHAKEKRVWVFIIILIPPGAFLYFLSYIMLRRMQRG
ncbi:MAG: hypothetical protein GF401_19420 [Chitinivibrionales bacterium]|nr:hypothetical protein [Chitinivibrionales bacterium]